MSTVRASHKKAERRWRKGTRIHAVGRAGDTGEGRLGGWSAVESHGERAETTTVDGDSIHGFIRHHRAIEHSYFDLVRVLVGPKQMISATPPQGPIKAGRSSESRAWHHIRAFETH